MSKTQPATCQTSIVSVNNLPVTGATILSEGIGASSGVLIQDNEKAFYVASSAADLKTTLDKIVSALGKIADALTTLDTAGFNVGAGSSSTPSAPLITVAITEIQAFSTELNVLKGVLK